MLEEELLKFVAVVNVQPCVGRDDAHASAGLNETRGVEKQMDVQIGVDGDAVLDRLALRLPMLANGHGLLEEFLNRFILVAKDLGVVIEPIGDQAIPKESQVSSLVFLNLIG